MGDAQTKEKSRKKAGKIEVLGFVMRKDKSEMFG